METSTLRTDVMAIIRYPDPAEINTAVYHYNSNDQIKRAVLAAALLAPRESNNQVWATTINSTAELVNHLPASNLRYEIDTASVFALIQSGSLDVPTLDILAGFLPDDWRPYHTKITCQGGQYHIQYSGQVSKDGPGIDISIESSPKGGYPYTLTVDQWADMDIEDNHADNCPVFHPEHHADECPLRILLDNNPDATPEEEARAEAECECGADDCGCTASIEKSKSITITSNNETDFKAFIQSCIYGED